MVKSFPSFNRSFTVLIGGLVWLWIIAGTLSSFGQPRPVNRPTPASPNQSKTSDINSREEQNLSRPDLKQENGPFLTLPDFTTFDRVIGLSKGMTKSEVFNILEVYPYKILYNENNDCEVNVFKCGIARRSMIRSNNQSIVDGSQDQIDFGETFYTKDLQDLILFYSQGKLQLFVNKDREELAWSLLAADRYVSDNCDPTYTGNPKKTVKFKPIEGCMDTASLNFDPKATYSVSGDCLYPRCGYVKLHLTPDERKRCDVLEIPSEDLWNYWLADGRCDLIRQEVEIYPPLSKRLPPNFFEKCKQNPKSAQVDSKKCDWCDVLNQEKINPSQIMFNLNK